MNAHLLIGSAYVRHTTFNGRKSQIILCHVNNIMQMWRKNRIYHEHDEFQRNFPIQIQAQTPTQPNYS